MKDTKSTNHRAASVASFLLSSLCASSVLAAPTVYPAEGSRLKDVKNQTSSVVIGDHEDPNTLYVLPPNSGTTEASGHYFSGNMGFCRSLVSIQETSHRLEERRLDLVEDMEEFKQMLKDIDAEIDEADPGSMDLEPDEGVIVDRIIELKDQIVEARDRIDALRDSKLDCDESDSCDSVEDEIDTLKDDVKDYKDQLRELRREHKEEWQLYREADRELKKLERKRERLLTREASKQGSMNKLLFAILDMYSYYAKLEGGFANIEFISDWDANARELIRENPSFHVQKIGTRDVNVNMALIPGIGSASYFESLPAVLGFTVNGQNPAGDGAQNKLLSMPEQMGANVRLSLVGACPIQSPEDFEIVKDSDGLPVYGLTVSYAYPTTFKTNVSVTYNAWDVYERMKKVSKKGGFFKTSTRVEELENRKKGSLFTFEFHDEQGMTSEQKQEIKNELMAGAMQEILNIMGQGVQDPKAPGFTPENAPQSGALVIADGLKDTCSFNIFCKGASWVFRGLNAIFGGSNVEQSFKSEFDREVERTYLMSNVHYRHGLVGFKRSPSEVIDEEAS